MPAPRAASKPCSAGRSTRRAGDRRRSQGGATARRDRPCTRRLARRSRSSRRCSRTSSTTITGTARLDAARHRHVRQADLRGRARRHERDPRRAPAGVDTDARCVQRTARSARERHARLQRASPSRSRTTARSKAARGQLHVHGTDRARRPHAGSWGVLIDGKIAGKMLPCSRRTRSRRRAARADRRRADPAVRPRRAAAGQPARSRSTRIRRRDKHPTPFSISPRGVRRELDAARRQHRYLDDGRAASTARTRSTIDDDSDHGVASTARAGSTNVRGDARAARRHARSRRDIDARRREHAVQASRARSI